MKITVNQFAGMAPKLDPAALADDLAQIAHNVSFEPGVVTGEMASVTASAFGVVPSAAKSIARPPTIDTRFAFTYDTRGEAFANMLAPSDVWGRVYFLRPRGGKYMPSYTTKDHYTVGGLNTDPTAFDLGMPRPAGKIFVFEPFIDMSGYITTETVVDAEGNATTVEVGGDTKLDKQRVAYIFTFVDSYGHEGLPSDPSDPVELPYDAPFSVGMMFPAQGISANMASGYRRVYRAAFDGSTSVWQFIGDIPFTHTVWDDTVPLGTEGEALVSGDWAQPPLLQGMAVVNGAFLAGFDGNMLSYSAYMLPHAWPESHRFPLPYSVVAIKSTLGGLFIATNGAPFWASGTDPESAVPVNLGKNFPCISARSVVDMGGSVIYATHDGLVIADATGVELATAPYIDRLTWLRDFSPANITAFGHEGEYYFSVGSSWWVFSTYEGRGLRKTTLGGLSGSSVRQVFYDSPRDTTVILSTDGVLRDIVSAQTGEDFRWRSKRFRISPTHFSTGQVVATKYPVTLRVGCDDLIEEYEVLSERPIRLKALGLRNNWWLEVEAQATARVSSMGVAQSPAELIYG